MPIEREIVNQIERTQDETPETIRAKLIQRIEHIEAQGYHNQFDYPNYGVQYSDIYDKETQRVKPISETNLSQDEYIRKVRLMYESPELTEVWNENRVTNIAKTTFADIAEKYGDNTEWSNKSINEWRDEFVKRYVQATKDYFLNDDDFDYNIILKIAIESRE